MVDPKTLMFMQEQANRRSSLRAGKTGTRLLDDGENNVGNSTKVMPEVLTGGLTYTSVPQPTSNNSRILNLTAESNKAQSVTVVMTAALAQSGFGLGGPLTGIIEFGNGTQNTQVSFDIPVGPFTGSVLGTTTEGTQNFDSGAIIQLPTSIVRAYTRYDNALVQPMVNGDAFGAKPPTGPLPPGFGPTPPNPNAVPLTCKAFAAYFGRIHNKLYKTQYLYQSTNASLAITFGDALALGGMVFYCIPPFAKSVRLVRTPITAGMHVELWNEVAFPDRADAVYDIAGGVLSPIMPIEGNMNVIGIMSADAMPTNAVSTVRLVYEISF